MARSVLPLSSLTESDLAAWRDIARNAVEPNPFFEPDFVLPAARAFGPRGLSLLVAVDGHGHWSACVPVRRRFGPRSLAAWTHPYCFLGTPLVREPADRATLDSLLAQTRTSLLRIDGMRADGPVAQAIAPSVVITDRQSRAALTRASAERADRVSARERGELRRRRRLLERELDAPAQTIDRSDDPDAWREFMRIERLGWKGRSATAIATKPAHSQFFFEVCRRFAAAGRLRVLALGSEDKTVAMNVALVGGDVLFGFKSCFDEAFSKASPGVLLLHDVIDDFRERGTEQLFDSCSEPGNEWIGRILVDRTQIASLTVRGPGPAGAVGGWAVRGLRTRRNDLRRIRAALPRS